MSYITSIHWTFHFFPPTSYCLLFLQIISFPLCCCISLTSHCLFPSFQTNRNIYIGSSTNDQRHHLCIAMSFLSLLRGIYLAQHRLVQHFTSEMKVAEDWHIAVLPLPSSNHALKILPAKFPEHHFATFASWFKTVAHWKSNKGKLLPIVNVKHDTNLCFSLDTSSSKILYIFWLLWFPIRYYVLVGVSLFAKLKFKYF